MQTAVSQAAATSRCVCTNNMKKNNGSSFMNLVYYSRNLLCCIENLQFVYSNMKESNGSKSIA